MSHSEKHQINEWSNIQSPPRFLPLPLWYVMENTQTTPETKADRHRFQTYPSRNRTTQITESNYRCKMSVFLDFVSNFIIADHLFLLQWLLEKWAENQYSERWNETWDFGHRNPNDSEEAFKLLLLQWEASSHHRKGPFNILKHFVEW